MCVCVCVCVFTAVCAHIRTDLKLSGLHGHMSRHLKHMICVVPFVFYSYLILESEGAMKSFKGGMQDRNVGPLLPDMCMYVHACTCLTFNKKLNSLLLNIYIISNDI